ncbi:MAG: fumarylacetoacetate hydrolase family protein [Burkholderiales bacterium]|nr:fumarylacetoacetate hydrolase family protein [Burkholderiales bacterium]
MSGPNAVRALLGGLLGSAPVILGVGLAAAVELLAPRSANQGETRWLATRRADQFVANLNRGQRVVQALARLPAGLFIKDISVATLQTERTQLAAAIARRDLPAARQHFGTIAKAMAFDARATNAGVAAVGSEIGRFNSAMPPRQPSLSRPKPSGARDSGHWSQVTQRDLKAGRPLHAAVTSPPARLPALGQPSAPARRRSSLPDRQALVTHTGPVGTPEEIATRQLEATARDLREAAAIYHRRKKTLLAGGDAAALAKEVYDGTRLQMFGVSLAQFEAHLQAGQEQEGASGARVKAGAGAGGLRLKTLSVGLLHAWNGGALVDSRDPALQLSSVEEAEALQTAVLAGLQAGDSRATAWKAGATSKEARVSVAPLPTRGVLQGQQAQLLTGPGEALAVEAEIAYLLERPVTTLPNRSDTMSYFSGMFPAMEVIGSRLFEGLDAPELLRLADLQSHRALVLGPWLPLRQIDGNSLQCKVMIDGRIVRDSAGGHACGDPAWVLHGWMRIPAKMTGESGDRDRLVRSGPA